MSEPAPSVSPMMEVIPQTFAEGLAALEQGNELAQMGEVMQAVAISTICDRYEIDEERTFETIEQLMRFGADGTRSVGEFVALEVAAALGISPGSAIGRIAEVLNVRDRHPILWEATLAGTIRFYQAAHVASDCIGLSALQVTDVDRRCAQAVGQWSWARILKELPGWIIAADPEAARARDVLARSERKVHVSGIKDGQIEVFARLSPADGIALNDAITEIAAQLPRQELPADMKSLILDESDAQRIGLNLRRAAAMGQLARAACGQDVLPVRELVVRIDATQIPPGTDDGQELTGSVLVEKWGHLLASRLPELLAGSRVVVRPVIDPTTLGAIDPHDPTSGMRLALDVRDPYCVGPYGATPARACDADHTVGYIEGDLGQTSLMNLGNMGRFLHRAKTARKVHVTQVALGVFHWRYRTGYEFLVNSAGTIRLAGPTPPDRSPQPPPVQPYPDPPPEDPAWDLYPASRTWMDPRTLSRAV